MPRPFRIEGYAIACLDDAIADATGLMPASLKLEADQRFFEKALDHAAVVVHGRMSHEGQPNSPKRRRLLLTRRVKSLAPAPDNANAKLWNPAGASLEEACAAVGCRAGRVAVLGGPEPRTPRLRNPSQLRRGVRCRLDLSPTKGSLLHADLGVRFHAD
jgi:hypothetical protein